MFFAVILFTIASIQGFTLAFGDSGTTQANPSDWAPLVVAIGTAMAAIVASVFAGLASLKAGKAHETAKSIKQDMVIPSEPHKPIGEAMEHVMQGQSAMVDTVAMNAEETAALKKAVYGNPAFDRRDEPREGDKPQTYGDS